MSMTTRSCLPLGVGVLAGALSLSAQLRVGPLEQHEVDAAAADRGRSVWAAECINCHGTNGRGGDDGDGPSVVRSEMMARDRYGNLLGEFLKAGHPTQSGKPSASLTEEQIVDVAHFIHQRIFETLRSSPTFDVQDVLTGNVEAGRAYFNGAGQCTQCHNAEDDLAGIGGRMQPVELQQRFLFPASRGRRGFSFAGSSGPKTMVVVTLPTGESFTGELERIDNFYVSMRDGNGDYRTFKRSKGVTVVQDNPYQFHIDLLDKISDTQIHDIVAYLETLK
jgi:cytochrome c oxidase cbb3-type subunit III